MRGLAAAWVVLLSSGAALAQDEDRDEPAVDLRGDDLERLDGRLGISLRARVAFVGTPYSAPESGEARGRAASTVIRAYYEVVPSLRLGLRQPLLDTSPELPASAVVEERAFGGPELFGDWTRELTEETRYSLRLGLGIPIGAGTPDPTDPLLQNKAFALVHAVHGYREPELHVPGRLPVTPGAHLWWRRERLSAGASLKLPLLIQIGSGSDDPRADTNPLALAPVLAAYGAWDPWDWLFVTLRSWIAFDVVRPTEVDDQSASRVQPVIEPQLGFVLADTVVLAATVTLGVGGALGGELIAPGLHVLVVP